MRIKELGLFNDVVFVNHRKIGSSFKRKINLLTNHNQTDIEPFIEAFKSYDNVEFLCNKNRVKIYWGGFSIVQAEINLVKRALQNEKYLKYVLLSGADYPIKDNENSIFKKKKLTIILSIVRNCYFMM
ncbi:hypothetical protein EfmGK941_19530 [Enterococcus faecium]|nr:hypothetical protein EfmGK941_19530 [Enterococcus faecium]